MSVPPIDPLHEATKSDRAIVMMEFRALALDVAKAGLALILNPSVS